MEYKKVKGTRDIFGREVKKWKQIEDEVYKLAKSFYLEEIRTPIIEYSEIFKRAIGSDTDIVTKEMFEFTDRGGREISLRPEETASVVRALVENSLYRDKINRYFYIGPMFRAEKPQKGRLRQFHQIGVEIFGDASPFSDFDVIAFNIDLLHRLNLRDYLLKINSVGCSECRRDYHKELGKYLEPKINAMCLNCQRRFKTNLMRVLDCKEKTCDQINKDAPSILDYLCEECNEHFILLKKLLNEQGIDYEVDTTIVRGLDYYTKTAFEIQIKGLGSQNAVCGGGRYDKLIHFFNPKIDIPAVGSAIGFERLVMALIEDEAGKKVGLLDYYMIIDPSLNKVDYIRVVQKIREKGLACLIDPSNKNFSKQFKEADKKGARHVIIIGDAESKNDSLSVKNMETGTQKTLKISDFLKSIQE